ncbi:AAA family ATPase [Shewanella algae]|nr:AAA family ATPase [Shewanella algae]QXP31982.1 AAA family ATPase [Shewanella algae]QXP36142.1 AAA family ATPase [Shewanella algae]QXP40327.1 AAA family ATPase [Shewanella algae]
MTTVRGKVFDVTYDGGKTFRVFPSSTENEDPYYVASMENVQRLYVGESKKGMYNPSYVEGMLRYLLSECGLPPFTEMPPQRSQPFVLIIDEINRGNISRIFGELITLIEPSKRAGAPEALEVMLPYSKKPFKVPGNVYLIGTMNTADRSLAGLDIALRRRFTFKEMPPKPELFKELIIEGINIQMLLEVMNQRIAVLLDRDHCLGHAYFMPLFDTPTLEKLADIFKQNIIPLLQEYFFEDWERIRWVLNDQNKAKEDAFIVEESANLAVLFPGVSNKLRQSPRWRLNAEAFSRLSAFAGIVTSATSNTQSRENAPVSDLEPVDA